MFRIRPKPAPELARLAVLRAWEVIGAFSTAAGLISLLAQGAAEFLIEHAIFLASIVSLCAIVAGALRILQPSTVRFTARGCALEVEIKVADLFDQPGNLVIPVNDFFDTTLGAPVSPRSVHGQFLQRQFPSDEQRARSAIDAELASRSMVESVPRSSGATKRYAVGETITLPRGSGDRFILFALARTNAATHKTEASLPEFVGALEALWEGVRNCCNHEAISVPLMGAKTGRVGLPKLSLAELLLSSAVHAEKKQPIASRMTLVLQHEDLAEIDLFDLQRRFS